MKISEQERRNAWLSVYTASVAGLCPAYFEKGFDEEDADEIGEIATALADGGLDDYESAFGGEAEVEEEEEPECKPRKRRRS